MDEPTFVSPLYSQLHRTLLTEPTRQYTRVTAGRKQARLDLGVGQADAGQRDADHVGTLRIHDGHHLGPLLLHLFGGLGLRDLHKRNSDALSLKPGARLRGNDSVIGRGADSLFERSLRIHGRKQSCNRFIFRL